MEAIQDQVFSQRLGMLALMQGNRETIDAFVNGYRELMTDVYNEMMQLRNIEKVRTGVYTAHGEMLKALLQQQIDYLEELARQEEDEEQ